MQTCATLQPPSDPVVELLFSAKSTCLVMRTIAVCFTIIVVTATSNDVCLAKAIQIKFFNVLNFKMTREWTPWNIEIWQFIYRQLHATAVPSRVVLLAMTWRLGKCSLEGTSTWHRLLSAAKKCQHELKMRRCNEALDGPADYNDFTTTQNRIAS